MEAAFTAALARSTISGWLLCVIGVFGIWRLYVIGRPKMRELEIGADEQVRDELWKEINDLKRGRINDGRRLTINETHIAAQTIRLGQQEFVLKLVINELERVSPGNEVARQARMLLDQVQPAAFVMPPEPDGDLVERITRPGVGE